MNLNPFLTVFAVLMAAETSLGKEAPAENGKRAIIDFSVVRSIDAVFVGRDELFRSAPTPEMIEHDYEYKVSIKDAQRWNKYPELCRQLATIRYTAYGSKAELRYAIIGYAKDGTRIFSLYLGYITNIGELDGKPITIERAARRWIEEAFPRP